MNDFVINLLFSFIIGGVWITFLSIFSEKFGSKVGGAITGIPATMVISLLFIAITQGSTGAVNSTTIIPLMLGINILFVLIFILFLRFGIIVSLLLSLTFWFMTSLALKILNFNNFIFSVLSYILLIIFGYYILEYVFKIKSVSGKKVKYTKIQITVRGLIAGTTILVSVLFAKLSGPLLGGVFASFPALTIALILLFHQSNSKDFTISFLKNFVITGTINVFIFILGVRYTYISLGVLYGTILSITLSIITAYLLYHFVNKQME